MFKFISGVLLGTQLAPYVNPYISKYILTPLIEKLEVIDNTNP